MKLTPSHKTLSTSIAISLLCFTPAIFANNFDSPAPVNDPASAMYTVDDLYNRLNAGATGTKRSNTFTEPTSGPASSSKDLNEVMGVAPVIDDIDGATAAEVTTGKKFWSLQSGSWGEQTGTATMASGDATDENVLSGKTYSNDSGNSTGTMADSTENITPGNTEKTITQGYHDGTGKVATDANLIQSNIKSGTTIFGVPGSFSCPSCPPTATGDAVGGDVLTGKTFSNGTANGVSGSMVNNAASSITPDFSSGNHTIPSGYYNGSGVVIKDPSLSAANIRSGATIFGLAGNSNVVNTSTGDALAADILKDKKAFVGGSIVTGTLESQTLSASSETVIAGNYEGTTLSTVDNDLASANIKSGTTIFGVQGTYRDSKIGCSSWVISYMPYSSTASQIIYASRFPVFWFNAGATNGDLSVTAIDDAGNSYILPDIPLGLGVKKLAPILLNGLTEKGFNGGKISFTFTAQNPENVMFFASYNAGGLRGFVEVICPP